MGVAEVMQGVIIWGSMPARLHCDYDIECVSSRELIAIINFNLQGQRLSTSPVL